MHLNHTSHIPQKETISSFRYNQLTVKKVAINIHECYLRTMTEHNRKPFAVQIHLLSFPRTDSYVMYAFTLYKPEDL